jgi:hypothetical protein
MKGTAFAHLGLHPDLSMMRENDLSGNIERKIQLHSIPLGMEDKKSLPSIFF